MEALRSPANPTDAVMMGKQSPSGETLGQALERLWGVSMDMPVAEALPVIQEKIGNANMITKTQKMAGGAQGAPQPAPQPPPQGGIGAMMGR